MLTRVLLARAKGWAWGNYRAYEPDNLWARAIAGLGLKRAPALAPKQSAGPEGGVPPRRGTPPSTSGLTPGKGLLFAPHAPPGSLRGARKSQGARPAESWGRWPEV